MLLYKTKYPLSIYILFVALALLVYCIGFNSILKLVFYVSLIFCFLYVLFSRYAGRVKVFQDKIRFEYFFFWDKNITVYLNDVLNIRYKKGFYDFIDDNTIGGLYSFPKYCFDKIIFITEKGETEICINTRIFTFNKMFSVLLKQIDSG